jgi:bifunctional DNA-binding transcriptional regulator/antitoxin component of YhaV-PrlF toxin-antitoxin module
MSEYTSIITRKGQATVPVEIRRSLGLEQGDRITWVPQNGQVVVQRAKSVTERTAGILKPYLQGTPLTIEEETEAFEQAVADEVMASMNRT